MSTGIIETSQVYDSWSLEQLAEEANEAAGNAERQLKASETNMKNAGLMLIAAKAKLKHGEWGEWLKKNWKYKHRWANECMAVASGKERKPPSQIRSECEFEDRNERELGKDIQPLSANTQPEKPLTQPTIRKTTKETQGTTGDSGTARNRAQPVQGKLPQASDDSAASPALTPSDIDEEAVRRIIRSMSRHEILSLYLSKEGTTGEKVEELEKALRTLRRGGFSSDDVTWPKQLEQHTTRAALDEWLEYRKKIRKPYKLISSVNKLLQDWADKGAERFVAAVSYSMQQEYHGLFENKGVSKVESSPTRVRGDIGELW